MTYWRIFVATTKNHSSIYSINNNSLIKTEIVRGGWYYVLFISSFIFYFFRFLSKRCSLKIVVPGSKNMKKDNLWFYQNLWKIPWEFSLVKLLAFWLQPDWKTNSLKGIFQFFIYSGGTPILRNSSKRLLLVVVAITLVF